MKNNLEFRVLVDLVTRVVYITKGKKIKYSIKENGEYNIFDITVPQDYLIDESILNDSEVEAILSNAIDLFSLSSEEIATISGNLD